MNIAEQIQKVAVNTFLAILPSSADDNAAFRMLLTVKVGDEVINRQKGGRIPAMEN